MNNYRAEKKKFNFKHKKDCTIKSLKNVNAFLCNLNSTAKGITVFKWLKH